MHTNREEDCQICKTHPGIRNSGAGFEMREWGGWGGNIGYECVHVYLENGMLGWQTTMVCVVKQGGGDFSPPNDPKFVLLRRAFLWQLRLRPV